MVNVYCTFFSGTRKCVPEQFSKDMQMIIDEIFQQDPELRPSVNDLLKKPFFAPVIAQMLQQQLEGDFSRARVSLSEEYPGASSSKVGK